METGLDHFVIMTPPFYNQTLSLLEVNSEVYGVLGLDMIGCIPSRLIDKSERTIQTLEDMLRACVIDLEWLGRTLTADRILVSPWKGCLRHFGKQGKIELQVHLAPFKVLAKVGTVAYRLKLPQHYDGTQERPEFTWDRERSIPEKYRAASHKNHTLKECCNLEALGQGLLTEWRLKSMFDSVHDMCLFDFVENVNSRGRTFTIVGNSCPLTRITLANVVPPKKTTSYSVEIQKLELKVYSRKPKNVKNVGSSKKAKIVESNNANHSEPNHNWGSNATNIPSSSSLVMIVRFGNDHIARIMGYGDYQLGNVTISRTINLEGVDLLSGSRDTNLYTISLDDMLQTSPIYLLSKASKTKSWLWHRRLSHLNFGTINKLAKDGLARGILRLKFQKDHLCSACALRKSKKSSHQPKVEDTNQEKLYLLHMDLCGPMRVASVNGKRYILVIVDDYLRFTWVRFLRTKDEAPEANIKCIKNIQVCLNATVHNVRTDNGTEFVNQTLREFYENVIISHQNLLPALLRRTALSKGKTELL
ncbi:retrovirus-related pol polyprotein from transposon TNT 1-94 [Tanacetum coccineum]